MKNILSIILLFFTIQLTSFGQSCKYYEDKVDDMTNDTIVSTFGIVAKSWTAGLVFTFKKVNSSNFIRMSYGIGGTKAMVIGKGDKMIIKLGNDSIITLNSIEVASGEFSNTSGVRETKLICFYSISKEELQAININKIAKVRIYLTDSYVEMDASKKKKHKKALYKALGCFLKRI